MALINVESGYGKIYKEDGYIRKDIKKNDIYRKYKGIPSEVYFMKLLKNIKGTVTIKSFSTEKDKYSIYMIENKEYIDLFDFLSKYSLKEEQIYIILKNIIETNYKYYKNFNVFHGDIKDENILIHPKTLDTIMIDFGYTYYYRKFIGKKTFSGTIEYCPPEFKLTGCTDDMKLFSWTFGLLIYDLVFSKYPCFTDDNKFNFENYNVEEILLDIKDVYSVELLDLIKKCLTKNQEERIKIYEIYNHPFFKNNK